MTTYVFVNNYNSTLAAAVTSSATTLTVASSAGLPTLASGDTWTLTLSTGGASPTLEIVYVTAISGTTLTVARGQEGTAAVAWASGSACYAGVTAAELAAFAQGTIPDTGGTVTSVAVAPPAGFAVSGSPITSSGTFTWSFAPQAAGLFLATPVTGGSAGPATWRAMAAADVNGALGYTPIETIAIASANGISGTVAVSGATQTATLALGAITPSSVASTGAVSGTTGTFSGNVSATGAITCLSSTNTESETVQLRVTSSAAGLSVLPYCTAGAYNNIVGAGDCVLAAIPSAAGNQNLTLTCWSNTESGIQIQPGGTTVIGGALTTTTMNATASDRRLKRDIHKVDPRPLHRAVPFVGYVLKESGWHGVGSVAQRMQKVAPEHVGEFDSHGKKRLSLNYAGAAYEQAVWASIELDKAIARIKKLEARLAALERRV